MSMANPAGGDGSLELLDIEVSTSAPEDILTPNAVKAARFRKSKPWGYLADDVQNFVDIVQSSVQWYRDKLYERDKDVHRLGQEIDDRNSQIANLNLQLASASYNSNVSEAISRNAEDKEMADLLARQQLLEADLNTAQREVEELQSQLTAALDAIPAAAAESSAAAVSEADLEELRVALTAVQTENSQLQAALAKAAEDLAVQATIEAQPAVNNAETEDSHAELTELREQNRQLEAYNKQLEEFVDQQEAYINSLLSQLPQDDDEAAPDGLVEDAEGEPHDGEETLTETEAVYETAAASETEEPEEQTYATDVNGEVEDIDDETQYVGEHDDEGEADEPAPNRQGDVYMYNGMPLPPGIRPEDL